ncbi:MULTISPECIES: hypothetical protein [Paenibacillus]|uniref:Uncharacterized protein n=1 Tax=Paenibacillus radicis (ex Gao et al. 2016) TaxID=1737354 RepID=A0A917HJ74_9BACL|nr:hypothetical protein [Paenibacillus radicis (ex Gao et al. 2016)]GGG81315.1 hypothetical protein GCM10010918_43210 [Paenibacillus radicis (ex Gao et al. 2016)]
MRSILMTLLLLIVVIVIYTNVMEGERGMNKSLSDSGDAIGGYIRQLSP